MAASLRAKEDVYSYPALLGYPNIAIQEELER
jgi:hypothetical protein